MHYRYVDDTFAVFNDKDECNEFFSLLEISKFWHYLNHFLVSSYFFGLRIGCRTRVFSFAVAFK